MRRTLLVVTIAALLVAQTPLHGDDLLFNTLGNYLESLRTQAGIPGLTAALIGSEGKLWERSFGLQDISQANPTRTDTPFHLDALTELLTTTIVLRCVEEGRLSLDDTIGQFKRGGPDAEATIRQILTETTGRADSLSYSYRPQRFDSLAPAVRACTGDSYRETLSNLLGQLAMADSVPGADVVHLQPPAEGIPGPDDVDRYTRVLGRLATPYAVDQDRHASPSQYVSTTLTPGSGLISTVLDYVKFDLALRQGILLQDDTLAAAWRPERTADGRALPHGMGWFVQSYNGKPVVWQFGVGENASSSLVITAPTRSVTLILLANSDGLVKPFALSTGDVTLSPFARVFLGLFVR